VVPRVSTTLVTGGPGRPQDKAPKLTESKDLFKEVDYCREPPGPLGEGDGRWLDATLTAGGLRRPRPPHEEVALAAYYAWEREGRPHGRDLEHWNDALAHLRRQRRAD
jgi:hypothetical protein